MLIVFWIILITVVSLILAVISLKRELQRNDSEEVTKEISRNRVIYHSAHFKKD